MLNDVRKILLLVEGADDEVNLFKQIIKCFPEIRLSPDNILIYNTNLWVLYSDLSKEFGTLWYESDDIDFRVFLETKFAGIKCQKITDIFLVFDYERQDFRFDAVAVENMSKFFNDSVENGQLYINYPMVESCRHLIANPLPDDLYKSRICKVADIKHYKATVGRETKYHDYRKYDRKLLQSIIQHNIMKIAYIMHNVDVSDLMEIVNAAREINHYLIVKKQNQVSAGDNGFVYVLCTCVLFVTDYNVRLLY